MGLPSYPTLTDGWLSSWPVPPAPSLRAWGVLVPAPAEDKDVLIDVNGGGIRQTMAEANKLLGEGKAWRGS